jgi:hypothetical protein
LVNVATSIANAELASNAAANIAKQKAGVTPTPATKQTADVNTPATTETSTLESSATVDTPSVNESVEDLQVNVLPSFGEVTGIVANTTLTAQIDKTNALIQGISIAETPLPGTIVKKSSSALMLIEGLTVLAVLIGLLAKKRERDEEEK